MWPETTANWHAEPFHSLSLEGEGEIVSIIGIAHDRRTPPHYPPPEGERIIENPANWRGCCFSEAARRYKMATVTSTKRGLKSQEEDTMSQPVNLYWWPR